MVNHKATKTAFSVGPNVGLAHFGGYKILNFNIIRGFQKNKYFWGYEDFEDILGVITKLDCSLEVIFMHFSVFLKANVQNGNNLFGLLNLK